MSVGPMGMMGSVAGSQLPQATGTDADKAKQATANQSRQSESEKKAERASLGEAEQDQGASDRDADGRRLWEAPPEQQEASADENQTEDGSSPSRDPTGERGENLDLSG